MSIRYTKSSMKSISIDSEKYVKATDIARELGYTADYVGQLCRARKIDAQLVGRSWYVSEVSIRNHKNSRYRSTKSTSKKALVTSLETKDLDAKDTFIVPVSVIKDQNETLYAKEKFYSRSPIHVKTTYHTDESELIPIGADVKNKTGRLSVSLGGAQTVKIKSKSKEFDFTPTARQEISFSGSLKILDVEDYDNSDAKNTEKLTDTSAEVLPSHTDNEKNKVSDISSKIRVKHLRKEPKHTNKNLPIEHNIDGILGMRRSRISDRNPMGGTLKVNVPSANMGVSSSGVYLVVISTIVSVLVSFFIVGLQTSLYTEGSTMITSYSITFEKLLAAVYLAW